VLIAKYSSNGQLFEGHKRTSHLLYMEQYCARNKCFEKRLDLACRQWRENKDLGGSLDSTWHYKTSNYTKKWCADHQGV